MDEDGNHASGVIQSVHRRALLNRPGVLGDKFGRMKHPRAARIFYSSFKMRLLEKSSVMIDKLIVLWYP